MYLLCVDWRTHTHLCCGRFDLSNDKVCLAIQCSLDSKNKVFLYKQSNWSVIVCGKEGVCLEIVCTISYWMVLVLHSLENLVGRGNLHYDVRD